MARRVEAVEGSCEVCGSTSWDSDDVRGETVCSECGYVASENMIDPGAEWVNHSNGDDRSRVGAPTTLTLSDKGLSTEIRRSDLTSGGAKRHGLSGKALRDWRRRQRIDQRSKTRDSRIRNLSVAMQFIRDRGDLTPQIEQEAASLYRHSVERGLGNWKEHQRSNCRMRLHRGQGGKLPQKIGDIGEAFGPGFSRVEIKIEAGHQASRPATSELIKNPVRGNYFEKFHSDPKGYPLLQGDAGEIWSKIKDNLAWRGKALWHPGGDPFFISHRKRGFPRPAPKDLKSPRVF
ncbi:MAG: hypothetical protein CM15mP6_0070 [Methanobacteriota archaeon]|nr:MAG: hypothetical protein CM15mP6_0070 [Euryarchaeota archaeon]